MLQILQFFSTRIADLGDSLYRMAHGVFALVLFSGTRRQVKFTPTLAVPASSLLDGPAKFLEPSQLWSPQPSNELPSTQGFEFGGGELLWVTKPLVLLSILVLLCLPFSGDLRGLISALLSLAQSFPSKFSTFIHAECSKRVREVQMSFCRVALTIPRRFAAQTTNWPRSVPH